jgi:hypothetical protein
MNGPRIPPDPLLEQVLRGWLRGEAPDRAPHGLFERVVGASTAGVQRRTLRATLRMRERPRPLLAVTAALAFIVLPVVIVGTFLSIGPDSANGPAVAPSRSGVVCPAAGPARQPGEPPASRVVGSLLEGRLNHTATELGDCRVLIVGGGTQGTEATASVELWDPAAGSVTELAPLANARVVHAATLLRDGRVLVVGGLERGPFGEVLGPRMTAEVWDPTTMTFSGAGTAEGPYAIPTATLLADGRVLVLGGGPGRTSALIWDPETAIFEPTGSLHEGRAGGQTATLLPDGTVLIVGGSLVSEDQGQTSITALASVEVWDPATGEFHEAPPMPEGRYDHTTTLLPSGRIVVAGGMVAESGDPLRQEVSASVLVRDAVSGVFHSGGSILAPRAGHDAEFLPDGHVLVIGGQDPAAGGTAEAWDPASGTASQLAPLSIRLSGTATRLPDGTLLLSGGLLPPASADAQEPLPLALDLEVYDPTP